MGQELVVQGAITGPESRTLVPLVIDNIGEDVKRVVVDLKECDLLTSDLIANLRQLRKALESRQIPVVLTQVGGINKQICERLGMSRLFAIEIAQD